MPPAELSLALLLRPERPEGPKNTDPCPLLGAHRKLTHLPGGEAGEADLDLLMTA